MTTIKSEIGTSPPATRLRALRNLQDTRIPTFGMLCPVFPDVLQEGQLETLLDQVRPDLVEYIWAEPYNDRFNRTILIDPPWPERGAGKIKRGAVALLHPVLAPPGRAR